MPLFYHAIKKRMRGSAKLQKREGATGRAIAKVREKVATFLFRHRYDFLDIESGNKGR